jgi:hypothetical protein
LSDDGAAAGPGICEPALGVRRIVERAEQRGRWPRDRPRVVLRGQRAMRERRRLLLGSVRSPIAELPRRSSDPVRAERRDMQNVPGLLLPFVHWRPLRSRVLHVRRAGMCGRRAVLWRQVRGGHVRRAQLRMQDLGQRLRAELRVLLAAVRRRAMLDRVVVLHSAGRRLRSRGRLLRGHLHHRPGTGARYLRRPPDGSELLQRRCGRECLQRMR